MKPEYLQQLVQRSTALLQSSKNFELPSEVDGVAISKAEGKGETCMANWFTDTFKLISGWELKLSYSSGSYVPTGEWKKIDGTTSASPIDQPEHPFLADIVNGAEDTDLLKLNEYKRMKEEQAAMISVIEAQRDPTFCKHDKYGVFNEQRGAEIFGNLRVVSANANEQVDLLDSKLSHSIAESESQFGDRAKTLNLKDFSKNE